MKRVLPADVYDALKASAERFGGIGAGSMGAGPDGKAPFCVIGHARYLDNGSPDFASVGPAWLALSAAGIGVGSNDLSVQRINRRRGAFGFEHLEQRVSFEEWAQELGVVRGDE